MESGDPETVAFDVDAAVEAAWFAAGDDLLLCAVYDDTAIDVRYANSRLTASFGDDEELRERLDAVHSYVNVDFAERDLFSDLLPEPGPVDAFATHMRDLVVVRLLFDRDGLLLGLAPGTSVSQVVEAVHEAVHGE